MRSKAKMHVNTLIDIEETMLRLALKEADDIAKLQLLINFRPNASLRQINNQCKLNFSKPIRSRQHD